MLENNNKKAIRDLARKVGKNNRVRNLILGNTVVLVAAMITAILMVCASLAENLNTMLIREKGTRESVTLSCPSEAQVSEAKKKTSVRAAGVTIHTGEIADESKQLVGELVYYDKEEFEQNIKPAISNIEGHYPVQEMEILLPKSALRKLGKEQAKIGEQITFYRDGAAEEFTLCGWFDEYVVRSCDFRGLVSAKYCEQHGYTMEKQGFLCLSAPFGYIHAMMAEMVLPKTEWEQQWSSEIDMVLENGFYSELSVTICVILGAILMIAGFLLIYNVMQISVAKDIRFYGLLKTIGVTPSQIYTIVMDQAVWVSLIGTIIGIGLGSLLAFGVAPSVLGMFDDPRQAMDYVVIWHPAINIATVLFVGVTVYISFRKPARYVAKISPIEAQKYQEHKENCVMGKGENGGKLSHMAWRNLLRSKKRAVIVFVSLFLGIGIALAVQTYTGGLQPENYTKNYCAYDYRLSTFHMDDKEDFQIVTEKEKKQSGCTETLAKKMKEIQGVSNVCVQRFLYCSLDFDEILYAPFLKQEEDEQTREQLIEQYTGKDEEPLPYEVQVVSVAIDTVRRYNERAVQPVDIEAFSRGEVCILGYTDTEEDAKNMQGKQVTIRREKEGTSKTMTVGSCMSGDYAGQYADMLASCCGAPIHLLVSEDVVRKMSKESIACSVWADCSGTEEKLVTKQVKDLARESGCVVNTEVKSEAYKKVEHVTGVMRNLGQGIATVFFIVGLVNFVHVFVTSIYGRRYELSLLESIGMTKRQIQKMLCLEGTYYALIETILILTIGNGIVGKAAQYVQEQADYGVFYYPYGTLIFYVLVIWCVCLLVPKLVYRKCAKSGVMERLKRGE